MALIWQLIVVLRHSQGGQSAAMQQSIRSCMRHDGLLRVPASARIRATRWLAMTIASRPNPFLRVKERLERRHRFLRVHPLAEQMAFLVDPARHVLRRQLQQLSRDRDRFRRQRANLAGHLARLGFGVSGRHHHIDEARLARLVGGKLASHHQHGEGALVAHGARHQQAGAPSGTSPRLMNGVEKVAVCAGEHIVAMEQHRGADADRDAVDGGDDRLDVVRQRIKEFYGVGGARGTSVFEVLSLRKSSRSLPAVNTPEPPVMMMQRISGLFCALSIASLIPRYMSWVNAFFFSGRRSCDHARRVFVRHNEVPGHELVPGSAGGNGAAGQSSGHILHDPARGQTVPADFPTEVNTRITQCS